MAASAHLTYINWPFSDDFSKSSIESTRNPYTNHQNTPKTQSTSNLQQPRPTTIIPPTTLNQQQLIRHWLTRTTPDNTATSTNLHHHLPTIKLWQEWCKKLHIQLLLHKLLAKNHWGDIPSTDPAQFHIIFKNVRWCSAAQALLDLDAHVLCLQEPNTLWNNNFIQPRYRIFQQTFMHAKITTSASIDTTL